jgi:hypothetical protein
MSEPDLNLCDNIETDIALSTSRVVVYDENFKPPKDQDIYITVALGSSKIIGNNNRFNPVTNEEEQYITVSETYNIEVTSINRDALTRYYEVITAIKSTYSQQKQELNQIRIFRTGQVLDLSFIEGTSSLHRYRIPVIINSTKVIEKVIDYYDNFQAVEEATE